MRLYFLALVPAAAALHVRLAPVRPRLGTPRCTLADGDVPFDRAPELPSAADLVAQNDGRRVAVSGLQPQAQQGQESQEYVGVPPPAAEPPRAPGMMSNARGPLIGFTLIATAGVSAWQSKRMLVRRQAALLEEFAGTMVFHLGDEREMATALRSFRSQVRLLAPTRESHRPRPHLSSSLASPARVSRVLTCGVPRPVRSSQLGPGRYTGRMFTAFLKAMATTKSIGVDSVLQLKSATALFGLTDSACAQYLESAASDLKQQPSVLGKLCFLAERAMPMPASLAKLRTKFPNWSFDTVTALQRAMLENLYRELCEDLPRDATPDAQTLEVLGLSEADARRLMAEVYERKEAEAAEAKAKAEEEMRALKLQRAVERAAENKAVSTRQTAPRAPPAPPAPKAAPPAAPPAASPPAAAPPAPADPATPFIIDDDEEDDVSDGPVGGIMAEDSGADDAPAEEDEEIAGASGTHEYECTKCGYVLFPAAGREFKFFGADFTCPGCGAGKDAFVDNGPVE